MQLELNKTQKLDLKSEILSYLQDNLSATMPPSSYRDFYLWAFSKDNPHQALWIETTGILQFARLAYALLDNVADESQMPQLLGSVPPMTLYLLFETISDNMAFGSAPWSGSRGYLGDIRQQFLLSFNKSMIARIQNPESAPDYSWYPLAEQLSSLSQSMNAEKQKLSIDAYLERFPNVRREEVEFGSWSLLAANIESCVQLINLYQGHPLQAFLQETLSQRYEGVNRLLTEDNLSMKDLLGVGTHTILVPSVLAYYSGVLGEVKGLDLVPILESGLLPRIFNNAALLIRMLNDVGTAILLNNDVRHAMPYLLKRAYQQMPEKPDNFFEFMLLIIEDIPELTRLHKDIEFGEFNISLHPVMDLRYDIPLALDKLCGNFHELAYLYHERYQQLMADIASLEDQSMGVLAVRFVKFHEKLYLNSFLSPDGEYAV